MINELEKQRDKLLYDIMLIDPNFDTDYLKKNYKQIYAELKNNWENILKSTGNAMKKAYYDMVQKNYQMEILNQLMICLLKFIKEFYLLHLKKKKLSC